MATITDINGSDAISTSDTVINQNFDNLNSDKIETSVLDTDTSLAANSDSKVATQKAVKAYVDAGGNVNASTTQRGIVEEATQAELTAGTQSGGSSARLFLNPVHTKSTSAGASDAGKIPRLGAAGLLDSTFLSTSGKVEVDTTEVAVVNGAGSENTMITATVPANTLSTNNALRFTCYFSNIAQGGGEYFTLRVKFGGTTFATFSENPSGIVAAMNGEVSGLIVADGATNLQKAYATATFYGTYQGELAADAAVSLTKAAGYSGNMALAIDSTAACDIVVTLEYSGTNGGNDATCELIVVEVIK